MEPTLLADVSTEMLCAREETFGPLVPVIRSAQTGPNRPSASRRTSSKRLREPGSDVLEHVRTRSIVF